MPLLFNVSFHGMLSSPLELRGISADLILTFASVVQTFFKPKFSVLKAGPKFSLGLLLLTTKTV